MISRGDFLRKDNVDIYIFGSVFWKMYPKDIDVLLIYEKKMNYLFLEDLRLYINSYFQLFFDERIHVITLSKVEERETCFINKSGAIKIQKERLILITLLTILGNKIVDEGLSKALSSIGEPIALSKFYKVIFKETFDDCGFSSEKDWNYFKIWLCSPEIYQKMINQFIIVPHQSDMQINIEMVNKWRTFSTKNSLDKSSINLGEKCINNIMTTLTEVVIKLFSVEHRLLLNRVTELNISMNQEQVNKESSTMLIGIKSLLDVNKELIETFGPESPQMFELPIETSQLWRELRVSNIQPNNELILKKIDYLIAEKMFLDSELEIISRYKKHATLFSINRNKQVIDSKLYSRFPIEFEELIYGKLEKMEINSKFH